ncbi:MAG: DUF1573 domain-containing protein [Chitinophagales bacterium]
MKYVNTVLLIALVAGMGVNFYFDYKHHKEVLQIVKSVQLQEDIEPAAYQASPFDHKVTVQNIEEEEIPKGPPTAITFARTDHDFGTIKEGGTYKTTFQFTNTGKNDLIISEALGSCGCTVPTWPEEPIKPGQTAEIKVQFDATDKLGKQLKTVTVTANTQPSKHQLLIHANVIEP